MNFVDVSSPDAAVLHLDDDALLAGVSDLPLAPGRRVVRRAHSGGQPESALPALVGNLAAAPPCAQRRCRAHGGQVVLRRPNLRCRTLLTRTGLAGMFAQETEGAKFGESASPARASS